MKEINIEDNLPIWLVNGSYDYLFKDGYYTFNFILNPMELNIYLTDK
jgi:hypothetical protein